MNQRVDSLYICPWSISDPLCVSQSLAYIHGLVDAGYKFALITFETTEQTGSATQKQEAKRVLAEKGIHWYPIDWQMGNSISDKLKGIWSAVSQGIKVCRRHRPQLIHSRSSLPVFAAVMLSRLFRVKFLYDADSLLSEEYLDIGHIGRESAAYRLLVRSERWARENAAHIIVLTYKLRDVYLNEFQVKVPVDVIPCCVNTEKFRPDSNARHILRNELGVTEEIVLTYVGKAGSWYLMEETFEFFRTFNAIHPASRLLVVSRDEPEVFHKIASEAGLARDLYFVRRGEQSDVPRWLSASDVSLSLIRQVKSKIGTSPVKFAEYLSVGLPIITTDGIGDCSEVVLDEQVGVVLGQTDASGYDWVSRKVLELLKESRQTLSARCSAAARRHFSLVDVGIARYIKIYRALLDWRG